MVRATSSNVLRRITTLLIISCLLTVGLCVNTAAALPGSGAQEDPWRIESLADFDEFAADANYWSGYTRLETDVNLAGRTYSTAVIAPDVNNSNYEFGGTAFTGVFDGNGHKIIGLTIEGGGARYYCLGFFGCIDDGQVGNLGLEGGSVSGDCFVGGLVGWNEGGSISSCYSTGTISGGANVGGLVGLNEGGSISNCYSSGSVSGTSCVGGLVGQGGTITNCYSTGSVTGDYSVGGLVGFGAHITNCYWTGSVRGDACVGGLVGNSAVAITNSYSSGSVTGTESVGGVAGDNACDINNCYSVGPVSGEHYVGGLVGGQLWGTISDCYSTAPVGGIEGVGGLVGMNWGTISNCYTAGSIIGTDYVGGLVGSNGYFDDYECGGGEISECYSVCTVTGVRKVGGLAGYNIGVIRNCYSAGSASGEESIGGLVGDNARYWPPEAECFPWPCPPCVGAISYCYSIGSLSGSSYVGGLVGSNAAEAVANSFWDVNTSGWPTSDGGTPKTTEEMQTKAPFIEFGWDFVEIWLINNGATYPVLRQEIRSDLNGAGGIDLLDFAVFADHWLEGTAD